MTQLELVGPRSANPDTRVYNPQYNTILPGAGMSCAICKDNKTVFRAGYAMSSDRNSLRNADTEVGSNPRRRRSRRAAPCSPRWLPTE